MTALTLSMSPLAAVALAALAVIMAVSATRAARRLADAPAWRRLGVPILNAFAWLAMAVLLAPPEIERTVSARATLLTSGASPPADPPATLYALSDAGEVVDTRVRRLATAGQLPLRHPDLEALRILGHGLDESTWRTLPADLAIEASPSPLAGPVRVAWPAVLSAGETLTVTGELRLADPAQVAELRLVDPAGIVTGAVSARSGQAFSLDAVPRAAGALTYRLQVLRGDATLSDDPVDVFVRSAGDARLLVVQSAPSFDTRQLTNWAVDHGSAVVVHTRISRERDLSQGFNLPADAPLERTPALLAASDLAVVDGRRWMTFDDGERALFLGAVREGMGLLLLVDDALGEGDGPAELAAVAGVRAGPADPAAPESRFPAWAGMTPARPLPVAPYQLMAERPPGRARTLTVDEVGRLLETWRPLGAGRIAVSLLRERQRWATSGAGSDFGRYWNRLLREVGRATAEPRWQAPASTHRRRPGKRFAVCAETGAGTDPAVGPALSENESRRSGGRTLAMTLSTLSTEIIDGDASVMPLRPHAWGSDARCAFAWPAAAGWHRLRLLETTGGDRGGNPQVLDEILFRVSAPAEWAAHEAERRQRATLERAARARPDTATRSLRTPLSPWWPWTLLIVAGSLLWLERRWDDLG